MKLESKIISLESGKKIIQNLKNQGFNIVFTNGCFDILHPGHVLYLQSSKEKGDFLVVGLNSDSSILRLKGSSRPIQQQEDRAVVLAGLSAVDYVIIFEEDTPAQMVEALLPDIITKGGDYLESSIVGGTIVKEHGGEVIVIPMLEGYSSTRIIEKMKPND